MKEQREIERRYALIDDVTKAVSETNTAAEDILALFKWERSPKELTKAEAERRTFWQTASRNWRVTSKILQSKIETHFDDTIISSTFEALVNQRRQYGIRITTLIDDPAPIRRRLKNKAIQAEADAVLALVNATRDKMNELVKAMAIKTRLGI